MHELKLKNEHPPVAIAPQKTAARTAQRTVRERRNGTRVRRIQLVEDGEDVTIPLLSPGRRPPAMAGGILRPLPRPHDGSQSPCWSSARSRGSQSCWQQRTLRPIRAGGRRLQCRSLNLDHIPPPKTSPRLLRRSCGRPWRLRSGASESGVPAAAELPGGPGPCARARPRQCSHWRLLRKGRGRAWAGGCHRRLSGGGKLILRMRK